MFLYFIMQELESILIQIRGKCQLLTKPLPSSFHPSRIYIICPFKTTSLQNEFLKATKQINGCHTCFYSFVCVMGHTLYFFFRTDFRSSYIMNTTIAGIEVGSLFLAECGTRVVLSFMTDYTLIVPLETKNLHVMFLS